MSGKIGRNIKRRHGLDIKSKKEIISLAQRGYSHQKIAIRYHVGRSTITKILANKGAILNSVLGEYNERRKRIRNSKFDVLEKKLLDWCTETKNDNYVIKPNISACLISEKAMELAIELGYSNFTADNEWLNRFRRKYNLRFRILKKYNLGSNLSSTAISKEESISTCETEYPQQNQNIHPSQLSDYIFGQNHIHNPTLTSMPYLSQTNHSYPMLYNSNLYPSNNIDNNTIQNIGYNAYQYPSANLGQGNAFSSYYFDSNMYHPNLFY